MRILLLLGVVVLYVTRIESQENVASNAAGKTDGVEKHDAFKHFAGELIKQLASTHGNIVIAPYVAALFVSDIARCVDCSVQDEMVNAFGLNATDREQLFESRINRSEHLAKTVGVAGTSISHTFAGQSSSVIPMDRTDPNSISNDYSNVSDVISGGAINEWIATRTNGTVTTVISANEVSSNTGLVPVNLYAIDRGWGETSPPSTIENFCFNVNGIKWKQVPMTRHTGRYRHGHLKKSDATFVEIPLAADPSVSGNTIENLTMFVVVPNYENGTDRLMKNVYQDIIDSRNSTEMKNLTVYLPLFIGHNTVNLDAPLQRMGINKMFSTATEYKGLGRKNPVKVEQFYQVVTMDIDKDGVHPSSSKPRDFKLDEIANRHCDSPNDFIADRPYVIVIMTNSGIPLVVAAISDPTENFPNYNATKGCVGADVRECSPPAILNRFGSDGSGSNSNASVSPKPNGSSETGEGSSSPATTEDHQSTLPTQTNKSKYKSNEKVGGGSQNTNKDNNGGASFVAVTTVAPGENSSKSSNGSKVTDNTTGIVTTTNKPTSGDESNNSTPNLNSTLAESIHSLVNESNDKFNEKAGGGSQNSNNDNNGGVSSELLKNAMKPTSGNESNNSTPNLNSTLAESIYSLVLILSTDPILQNEFSKLLTDRIPAIIDERTKDTNENQLLSLVRNMLTGTSPATAGDGSRDSNQTDYFNLGRLLGAVLSSVNGGGSTHSSTYPQLPWATQILRLLQYKIDAIRSDGSNNSSQNVNSIIDRFLDGMLAAVNSRGSSKPNVDTNPQFNSIDQTLRSLKNKINAIMGYGLNNSNQNLFTVVRQLLEGMVSNTGADSQSKLLAQILEISGKRNGSAPSDSRSTSTGVQAADDCSKNSKPAIGSGSSANTVGQQLSSSNPMNFIGQSLLEAAFKSKNLRKDLIIALQNSGNQLTGNPSGLDSRVQIISAIQNLLNGLSGNSPGTNVNGNLNSALGNPSTSARNNILPLNLKQIASMKHQSMNVAGNVIERYLKFRKTIASLFSKAARK